jgi:hypothetical protein
MRQLERLASDGLSGAAAVVVTPVARGGPPSAGPISTRSVAHVRTTASRSRARRKRSSPRSSCNSSANDASRFTTRFSTGFPDCWPHARESRSSSCSRTRGLASDFSFSRPPRVRARQITAQGLLFKPGTSVQYSNSDFVFLGLIVEKVTGRSLDQVVTSRIIRRLRLRSTSYGTEHAQHMAPWLGAARELRSPSAATAESSRPSTTSRPSSGAALLGGKLLADGLTSEMTRRLVVAEPNVRFGLGIFRKRSPCGYAWGTAAISPSPSTSQSHVTVRKR